LCSPLDMCKIRFDLFNDEDEDLVHHWIVRVVQCRAQWLSLHIFNNEDDETPWFPLSMLPLFSPYLPRLELYVIKFCTSFTQFSSCPALQDHNIEEYNLSEVRELESPSLRHLSITHRISCPVWRIMILVSLLVWMWLDIPSADRSTGLPSSIACRSWTCPKSD